MLPSVGSRLVVGRRFSGGDPRPPHRDHLHPPELPSGQGHLVYPTLPVPGEGHSRVLGRRVLGKRRRGVLRHLAGVGSSQVIPVGFPEQGIARCRAVSSLPIPAPRSAWMRPWRDGNTPAPYFFPFIWTKKSGGEDSPR